MAVPIGVLKWSPFGQREAQRVIPGGPDTLRSRPHCSAADRFQSRLDCVRSRIALRIAFACRSSTRRIWYPVCAVPRPISAR